MMGRCKVVTDTGKTCGQKAYFFCKTCSVHGENEALFYMCEPSTGRHCAAKHAAEFCEEHSACECCTCTDT